MVHDPNTTNPSTSTLEVVEPQMGPASILEPQWWELSPINQRRLSIFKANRRGFWSLWIFLAIFIISLGAEFIANDRPLIVHYDNGWYFPIVKNYPETDFGGDLATATNFRDPYVQSLIKEKSGWMLWPLIPYDYRTINYDLPQPAPSPPSAENWLGTDDQGRDVLARVIYGLRVSILFGLVLTFFSSIIGIAMGAIQGYFGGWLDLILQRIIEIWQSLPNLFILILFASLITPSFWWLIIILLFFSWTALEGVVRAEFLRTRNFDYVKAARGLGVGNFTIMRRHVLPNAMIATVSFLPFILNGSILALTSLDFLGLGLPPGSASLGEMLRQSKANLQAPWLGITTFLTLAILLSLLIFIGEAVRDALDPRKTWSK